MKLFKKETCHVASRSQPLTLSLSYSFFLFCIQKMLLARSAARALSTTSTATLMRHFTASAVHQTKVAVLGAGGGIGQPLSLLLKNDPLVSSLSLYDIRGAPGVAADVSHVDTGSEVYL